jgi:hypothetical protein
MAQVVEHLFCELKALCSNPSPTEKKKELLQICTDPKNLGVAYSAFFDQEIINANKI